MLTGALLGLMRQLGLDIITLTEELDETEFFSSRLTRAQTLQLLASMAKTAADIPAQVQARMPQIDWGAWAELPDKLARPAQHPFQIWVAIKELTPMTVQHLNDYKRTQPKLFSLAP
ncbi:MAG: hypothetical protein EPO42_02430 [Gallionellaceae bacterium]|nr:MAG: hypothetical protein EPO42_02430 [Gallionellaceae bacterium]